jgi:hypothetical protein
MYTSFILQATEILQCVDERSLLKMFKLYGGMKDKAKHASTAVVEARYMFHAFETVEVSAFRLAVRVAAASKFLLFQSDEFSANLVPNCFSSP